MIQSMVGKLQPGTEARIEVTDEFATLVYVTSMRRSRGKRAPLPVGAGFRSVATNAVAGRYVHFLAYASADWA